MTEINRAGSSVNLTDIAAQQRIARANNRAGAAGTRGLERASDSVELGSHGVARSKLDAIPDDFRSEKVNQIALEVNSPDFDIDGKLELAFDQMFG